MPFSLYIFWCVPFVCVSVNTGIQKLDNKEKKIENREENRERKSEETETCEELVMLTENHDRATPLLSTRIRLLRFMVVFLFPILLVFLSTQLGEEL